MSILSSAARDRVAIAQIAVNELCLLLIQAGFPRRWVCGSRLSSARTCQPFVHEKIDYMLSRLSLRRR